MKNLASDIISPMKVLIVDDDPDIRELISFAVTSHFKVEVAEHPSGHEALSYLQNNNDIGLLITDIDMKNGSGRELISFIEKNDRKVPIFICSRQSEESAKLEESTNIRLFIHNPYIVEPLIDELQKTLSKTLELHNAYVPVKVQSLLKSGILPSDIYIKLGPEKYLKILKEGDYFNLPDAEKYEIKRIEMLYIRRKDLGRHLISMVKDITAMQITKDELNFSEVLDVSTRSLNMIRDISAQVGFPESVQALTKVSANLVAKAIRSEPQLGKLFEVLKSKDKTGYIVDHSVVLASVACGIAGLLGWASETTFYKLALAGFLHDITIEDCELAQLEDLDEAVTGRLIGKYSPDDVEKFSRHPIAAAELLSKFSNVPQDVDHLIRQHHERPDGTGFPARMTYKEISPISAVFIFAEDLVNFMLAPNSSGKISTFCEMQTLYYSHGYFSEILKVVKK